MCITRGSIALSQPVSLIRNADTVYHVVICVIYTIINNVLQKKAILFSALNTGVQFNAVSECNNRLLS